MFGLFKRAEPCQLVYVVASRHEFRKWRDAQPAGVRYENIHNEACAVGLVHRHPPAKFVVLKSADFATQLRLHRDGFPVPYPVKTPTPPDWKGKVDKKYQPQIAELPEALVRDKMRKWHWTQHFKYAAEGDSQKAAYHRSMAKSIESKNKGQINLRAIARKQREEDIKLMELLDTVSPCAELKT